MASTVEDLEKLAEICLASAKSVKEYLAAHNHPQPTFDQNGPASFPQMGPEAERARITLRAASKTLYDLASGPDEPICQYTYDIIHDINAFRYVAWFKIAAALPLNEEMSYAELSKKTGTDERQLKKMLRQLIMIRVFCEPKPGYVSHTASSKLLADPETAGMNNFEALDASALAVRYLDAIKKWGHGSQEPNQAGAQIVYDSEEICFRIWEQHPDAMKRFSDCMTRVSSWDMYDIDHVIKGYDWSGLGESTFVDIGGNIGQCSAAVAQVNPKMKVIVQDLPNVIKRANEGSILPSAVKDRFTFQTHSFFDPQPVQGADVYFLRMIMHDYSDKYCVQILKNIVPAMKSNSRIVIVDQVMPPHGAVPRPIERAARTGDLMMMTLLNATEREYEEWIDLFARVDSRLKIKSIARPEGSLMSVIEVILNE